MLVSPWSYYTKQLHGKSDFGHTQLEQQQQPKTQKKILLVRPVLLQKIMEVPKSQSLWAQDVTFFYPVDIFG